MQNKIRTKIRTRATQAAVIALLALSTSACSSSMSMTPNSPQLQSLEPYRDQAMLKVPVQVPVPFSESESGYAEGRETIESVLRYAIGSNPAVRESTLGLVSASIGPAQAIQAYAPTFSLDLGAGATDNSGQTSVGRSHHAGGIFSWTAWDNGAAKLRENRELYRTLSALATVGERIEVVGLGIGESYLDVPRHRQLVALAEENIKVHEKLLGIVNGLLESRIASATDVADVNARLQGAKRRLVDAKQMLGDAEARYLRVVGQRPGKSMAIPKPISISGGAEAAVKAADSHPSIRINDAEIRAAVENGYAIDAEKGGSLGIKANIAGLVSAATLAHPAVALGTAFLSFTTPLLDGGDIDLRLRRAVSSAEIAIARREDIGRLIGYAVRQSHNAMTAAVEQEKLTRKQSAELAKVAEGRLAEYQIGKASIVQVLDAQNDLLMAKSAEVSAHYAYIFSGYRVLASQGKLNESLGLTSFRTTTVDGSADPFAPVSTIR